MYSLKSISAGGEGKWARIWYDEALDKIAGKLKALKGKQETEEKGVR